MHSRSSLAPTFAPERALLTVPWLAALLVLVVNDHVLKGSGLLPGVITGKLSDFAGLLVAPVLLATLVRARSSSALIACHVAVGTVFAGIQLSLAFAQLWSGAMGWLGHPWVITRDPTDLIALPMLVVSWRVLVPRMAEVESLTLGLHRLAVGGLSLVGLWSSVATSDIDGGIDPDDQWYEDIYANLIINNANEHDVAIHVRPLRPEVLLDCDAIERDPGRLLPAQAFGDAVHWVLPPRTNLAVTGSTVTECSAVWVAGEGIEPMILFWWNADYPAAWFPGQRFVGQSPTQAETALTFDELGATWSGGEAFRFAVDTTIPEQSDSCPLASDDRLDWDANLPTNRPVELLALDYGPDGCFALELDDLWAESTATAYVCAPESALPFVVGEQLRLSEGGAGVQRWLTVHRADPLTGSIALTVEGEPELRVDLLRGASTASSLQSLLGAPEVTPIGQPSCEWMVDDACASDERPFELAVVGIEGVLAAGDPTVVLVDPIGGGDSFRERELTLVHAQERALVDPTCIEGATSPGLDFDAVVVSRIVN